MASALLCLESSGNLCSVAVTGFDREAYLQSEPGQKHTKVILGMIRGCLTAAGGSREGLQGIAFGSGPGAFTGLRVACGLTQGLGWALNIPLIPVNTLLALAYIHHETLEEGSRLLSAIDARMHECYCAVFRYENHEFKEVTAPALCKPSELLAIADDNGAEFLCGNAFRIYADEIGDPAPKKLLSTDDVNAQMIVPLARKYFEENKTVDAAEASPLYVRDHVALTIEERKAEKSR